MGVNPVRFIAKKAILAAKITILTGGAIGCFYAGYQVRPIADKGFEMVEAVQRGRNVMNSIDRVRGWFGSEEQ